MYSSSSVAVDKGLGFDFSGIADLVKNALPVGLNVYQQQMQLKQTKAMAQVAQQARIVPQSPAVYGQQYGQLPVSQTFVPQPTFGVSTPITAVPRTGMNITTVLMIGGAIVISGMILMRALK